MERIKKHQASDRRKQAGAALVASVFGLLLLTLLVTSLFMLSEGSRRVSTNFAENSEAFYIAEAGIAHAVGLLVLHGKDYKGIDTEIPADGVPFGAGRYTVEVVNDTQPNTKRIISTGFGSNGSSAQIETVIQFNTSSVSDAAVVVNGNINIGGNLQVLGAQGVIHANGTMNLSGNNRAQQYYSASSTITYPANQPCPNGSVTGPPPGCAATPDIRQNQPQIPIPNIQPSDLFNQADYRFYPPQSNPSLPARITDKNGNVVATNCQAGCWGGWTYNSGQGWVANSGSNFPSGTYYAVQSSMQINRTFGTSGAPLNVTFVADGSISFSGGASYQTPKATLDGRKIAVLAGADIAINGANINTTNTEGTFYARHQFYLGGGQPRLFGNIFVYNEADTALYGQNIVQRQGEVSLIVSGDPQIVFNGNSTSSGSSSSVAIYRWREVRN
mgnify:CR=1 FL=1|jgi:Tfp pilus assembly protein PilX